MDSITADLMKRGEMSGAYKPGPEEGRSWSIESNRVPAINYNHADNGYFKYVINCKLWLYLFWSSAENLISNVGLSA